MESEEDTFKSWDDLIRDSFLASLECAKEIQPGKPEWDFIWTSLKCFKIYAENKYEAKKGGL